MSPKSFIKVAVFFVCSWCLVGAVSTETAHEHRSTQVIQREVPDDAAGRPARPVPGALPAPPIRFGIATTYQVNVDSLGANIPGDAANEPSIAVDPNNSSVMAIGWRQFDTVSSNFRQAGWGYSANGGRAWTFPGVIEPGVFRSDPVLGFDAEGNFFYNSLKVVGGIFSCQVFRSSNGGATWGSPAEALGGDKQWMTIDRTGSVGHGHFYCAWNTAAGCCGERIFNRSIDGGHTLCGINPSNYSTFYVAKSTSMRNPLGTPLFESFSTVFMDGSLRIGGAGSPNPVGLLGQVWLAVDRSGGPTHGNIYVCCSVLYPFDTDPLDVHFVRSTDGGATWSAPVRINTDPPSPGSWQWFATMSVAPNGRIDIVWNDTRELQLSNMSALYYSYSYDGGVNWSSNQRLSPTFNSHLGWPNQQKIGDYYDMVSDNVGADLAWSATFNGEQDVYYSRIGGYDCNANGVADSVDIAVWHSADTNENGVPDECEGVYTAAVGEVAPAWGLFQNIPNPFNPTTSIRYLVPDGGGDVVIRVFDVKGQLVRTLRRGFESAGEKTVLWDGLDHRARPVASGLYFYRLDAPGFAETRKMLLLR
jgi:hypothetical protein